MFHNAAEFLDMYGWESDCTARVLGALTDESLVQAKAEGHIDLGGLGWHVATSPAFMLNQVELKMPEFGWQTPEDLSAAKIQSTYADLSARTKAHAENLKPEDLQKVYHVFGMMDWPVWQMLNALIAHEVHHRGQISVLMRQAGLTVPNIYGPNFEETQQMMAKMAEEQHGS
jgi:uncharacterized damage-inducible protein DinB